MLFDVVRTILGICARLFMLHFLFDFRAYVGSLVVFGVLLTQLPVRSAIRNCGIVVITVDCDVKHADSACHSRDSHSQKINFSISSDIHIWGMNMLT